MVLAVRHLCRGQQRTILHDIVRQIDDVPSGVGQVDAGGHATASSLGREVGGRTQEERLGMSTPAVADRKGHAAVDPHAHIGSRDDLVAFLTGLGQDVDDQLGDGDGPVNPARLVAIGLCDHGVQTLVMEIDLDGTDGGQDAVNRPVMEVQEAQGALVAEHALDLGCGQHVAEVFDVDVDVDAVDPVGLGPGQGGQVGVADVVLDFDGLDFFQSRCDALGCACAVPGMGRHWQDLFLIFAWGDGRADEPRPLRLGRPVGAPTGRLGSVRSASRLLPTSGAMKTRQS